MGWTSVYTPHGQDLRVSERVLKLPLRHLARTDRASIQPERLRDESPGRCPGFRARDVRLALKGRNNLREKSTLCNPFSDNDPTHPLTQGVPWALIFDPCGLADEQFRANAQRSLRQLCLGGFAHRKPRFVPVLGIGVDRRPGQAQQRTGTELIRGGWNFPPG